MVSYFSKIRKNLIECLVTQLQYVKWPDHGIPDDPSDFLNFVNHFRTTLDDSFGSCLVHCSAGVGRTGVTIAVDTCIALISQNIPVNPLESVLLCIRNPEVASVKPYKTLERKLFAKCAISAA